jgi:Transposase
MSSDCQALPGHGRSISADRAAHTLDRSAWRNCRGTQDLAPVRQLAGVIANGLIEGINSLVQAAKAKARGYRSTRNLKAIIYLLAGKLDMQLPAF